MLLFSRQLANAIGSGDSRMAVFAIAPTLLFVSLSGGIRGYFQGRRNMLPTALSQLFEALGKLVLGVFFGIYAARRGEPTPIIAAYAILGVTIGAFMGTFYLAIAACLENRHSVRAHTRTRRHENRSALKDLFKIAFPITLSASVSSLSSLIDLTLILNLLPQAGYSVKEATALFGNYSTLVVPVAHAPTIFISPIAASLVPYLTAELARGKSESASELSGGALRFVSILTLPATVIFMLFGNRLLSLVFEKSSAEIASPMLAALAPSIFFFGLCSVTNAILEASGKASHALRSTAIGAVVKTAVGILAIGNPKVGIYGAIIGSVACYATTASLNMVEVKKILGRLPSALDFFGRSFAAASFSGFASFLLLRFLSPWGGGVFMTFAVLGFFAASYFVLLYAFRAILSQDLAHLPFASKLLFQKKGKD